MSCICPSREKADNDARQKKKIRSAAARTLHDHWRAGTKFAGLDAALRPRDRTEAYAIQAAIEDHSSGKLFGWKIAATSEAGQKHINVDGPDGRTRPAGDRDRGWRHRLDGGK